MHKEMDGTDDGHIEPIELKMYEIFNTAQDLF